MIATFLSKKTCEAQLYQLAATQHLQLLNTCCWWGSAEPTGLQCGDPCRCAVGFFLYYFRHWQTGHGRRVGKGKVRKVEEEAGYGKGRNESQCERGYREEDDVCSGNFIYYFSYWHYWIIDDHVDVNWHYDTADFNK